MAAEEGMILVQLDDHNAAKHSVYGPATKQYYGYRKHGDQFYVWSKDAALLEHSGTVRRVETPPAAPPAAQPAVPPADDDLATLWGVDATRADRLREAGLTTFAAVGATDVQTLTDLLEVSESIAKRIRAEAAKVANSSVE